MPDQWTFEGPKLDAGALERLSHILETESPIVVEHRFYAGAHAPHRFVCESSEDLVRYIEQHTRPGDSFYVWHFEQCCRDDNVLLAGKRPDAEGRVPIGGAY